MGEMDRMLQVHIHKVKKQKPVKKNVARDANKGASKNDEKDVNGTGSGAHDVNQMAKMHDFSKYPIAGNNQDKVEETQQHQEDDQEFEMDDERNISHPVLGDLHIPQNKTVS